ncbi:MAG: CBS domain-containing protein [Thermoleophilia bacterium]|nr:CBS domain-containing protein [Thermoleophilia bacterium]
MKTVKQILEEKHKNPSTIESRHSVLDALRLMAETDVGAVMVVDDGALVGVVSERDYVRKVAQAGIPADTPVKDVMTVAVVAVTPEHSVEQCMALMMQKHFRHLPVLDGGTLIGVISVRDVVKAAVDEREYRIDQLENYISGR